MVGRHCMYVLLCTTEVLTGSVVALGLGQGKTSHGTCHGTSRGRFTPILNGSDTKSHKNTPWSFSLHVLGFHEYSHMISLGLGTGTGRLAHPRLARGPRWRRPRGTRWVRSAGGPLLSRFGCTSANTYVELKPYLEGSGRVRGDSVD